MKKLSSNEMKDLMAGVQVLKKHFPGMPWWSVRLGEIQNVNKNSGQLFVNDQEIIEEKA